MSIRQQQFKESKKQSKYLRYSEDSRSSRIFIFSMIVGFLNYFLWHDQFLKLDSKYDIIFVVLPMILGVIVFYYINRIFIKYITDTKSSGLVDTFLSNGILILSALFFAYFSVVTVVNVVFKIAMNHSTTNKPLIIKTYTVESTFKNNRNRGIHLFSYIYYLDESNQLETFNVDEDEVETSNETRKITFTCQEGFWCYYKILDYKLE
jgi:hypothetical protein